MLPHYVVKYFKNSFTGRFSSEFAVKWLLRIPPHLRVLPHYLVKYLVP